MHACNERNGEKEKGSFSISATQYRRSVYISPRIIGRDNHVLMPDRLSNDVVYIICRESILPQ